MELKLDGKLGDRFSILQDNRSLGQILIDYLVFKSYFFLLSKKTVN